MSPEGAALPQTADLAAHRSEFPALAQGIYANFGARGAMAEPTIAAVADAMVTLQSVGVSSRMAMALLQREEGALKAALAALVGVAPEDIALVSSVSQGLALAFAGIDWRSGDAIVLGEGEPPGSWLWAEDLARRHGVAVRTVPRDADGAGLAPLLCPRTRLVVLSHVDWVTGRAIDLADTVSAVRHGPARKAVIAVDGAQAVGARPVDLAGLDIDLYAVSGQKWLGGPDGLAAAVIRSDRLHPGQIGWRALDATSSSGDLHLVAGARRFECGTVPTALVPGWRKALAQAERFAPAHWRHRRIATLTRRLRERLAAACAGDGAARLLGPADTAGLVAVGLPPEQAATVHAHLARSGIVSRHHAHPPAVRFSVHYLTLEAEVDRIAEAVASALADPSRAGG